MGWRYDSEKLFKINTDIVKDYFNKKASLVFSEEEGKLEEKCLLKFIPKKNFLSILDLGCGNGRWAKVLKNKISNYVGVDFSETFITESKKLFNNNKNFSFHCMSAEEYLSEEKFDIIFIIGLMTYMNDNQILKMIDNLKKMLSKSGRIIVRNVTLAEANKGRRVYDRKLNIIEKFLGRKNYQIIRRTPEEEINFFHHFELERTSNIPNTGYIFYIFK